MNRKTKTHLNETDTFERQKKTMGDWLNQKPDWTNLNAIGMVRSTVIEKGVTRTDTRYFITSLTDVNDFAYSVRKHWSIENQLHWCLDVVFREDSAKARKDNSPLNMNIIRKTALSLLKAVVAVMTIVGRTIALNAFYCIVELLSFLYNSSCFISEIL